jgi:hypothetical protein
MVEKLTAIVVERHLLRKTGVVAVKYRSRKT